MVKKVVLTLLVLLLVLVSIVTALHLTKQSKDAKTAKLLDSALTIGTEYTNAYRGRMDLSKISTVYVSDGVKQVLSDFDKELKSKETQELNVDKLFIDYQENTESGYIKKKGSTEVLFAKDIKDDNRIHYKDGTAYISLSDFDTQATGFESIMYKGVEIKLDVIPPEYISYETIVNSTDNIFNYTTHKFITRLGVDSLEVLYTSVTKQDKHLLLRFGIEGGKLATLEVNK
jgi:hypothetical protein